MHKQVARPSVKLPNRSPVTPTEGFEAGVALSQESLVEDAHQVRLQAARLHKRGPARDTASAPARV